MNITSSISLIEYCRTNKITLFEYAIKYEEQISGASSEDILQRMRVYWNIMEDSIQSGLDSTKGGAGKIIQRKARAVYDLANDEYSKTATGPTLLKAAAYSLAVMEVNSVMGKIVAAPTAGASGILPGVFKSLQETFQLDTEIIIEGLFVAGIVGALIAKNATLAGAKGGCQAEVGSASAMAAVAGLYMLGNTLEEAFSGGAIALKNVMGLICDPVAGLVEVPCQKRNAMGVANSLLSIDLVRAGMVSYIPFDEVVDAMKRVGDLMPACHRETATGGIAVSYTGEQLKKKILN